MQRRDSLGLTTKIPRLTKGSTRKFKTRLSQFSFSSVSDVFADNESTKGQAFSERNETKKREEPRWQSRAKCRGRTGERSAYGLLRRRGKMLIRPVFEPGEDIEREEFQRTEKKCCSGECPNQKLRVITGEKNNHLWSSRARMQ